ncbi:MAG: hypothetical protein ABJD97_01300 [Betaproteobacteria bacterium]
MSAPGRTAGRTDAPFTSPRVIAPLIASVVGWTTVPDVVGTLIFARSTRLQRMAATADGSQGCPLSIKTSRHQFALRPPEIPDRLTGARALAGCLKTSGMNERTATAGEGTSARARFVAAHLAQG